MNYLDYVDERLRFWNAVDLYDHPEIQQSFAICCANLRRFRPELHRHTLAPIYRCMALRSELTQWDQQYKAVESWLTLKGVEPMAWERYRRRPGIIASFHTGSYRLVGRMLARAGLPTALLVSSDVYREQKPFLERDFEAADNSDNRPLVLIDAGSAGCLHQMMRALKNGYNILAYVDGNAGNDPLATTKNAVEISFFASSLSVRRGISLLSYWTGAPVYPLLASRPEWDTIELEHGSPILPRLDRDASAQQTMVRLYAHLERLLRKRPEEWEGWQYMHTARRGLKPRKSQWFRPGMRRALLFPFALAERHYAIESKRGLTYPISKPRYQRLVKRRKADLNL